jgi:radical SAM protein with 4Fe4S-binding SPASM domain
MDDFCRRWYDEDLFGEEPGRVSVGPDGLVLQVDSSSDDDFWCPIGQTLTVDVTGDVYPCAGLMRLDFRLGNVNRDPLSAIQNSGRLEEVVQIMTERRNRIEKCQVCPWQNLCQGGCMACTLERKGTVWDVDPQCELRKDLYIKTFQRVAEGAVLRTRALACE